MMYWLINISLILLGKKKSGKLLKQVKSITLCLIPKCDQHMDLIQVRPIG